MNITTIFTYIKYGLIIIIILSVAYMYNELKNTKQSLKETASELSTVKDNYESQKQAIEDFKTKLNTNISIIKEHSKKQDEIDNKFKELNNKLSTHDVKKIADKKPKLLEKVINNSSNKINNELMEITK